MGNLTLIGHPRSHGDHTPEMQAELDRLERTVSKAVDFTRDPDSRAREIDEEINLVWNLDMPEVGGVLHIRLAPDPTLDAAPCDAVVYSPKSPSQGIVFYVHGGGWAFCNLRTHDRFMRVLCNETGRTVVGVHYRLAPEHPYPAALHDVVSAFRTMLATRDELGLPPGPIVVAGDSAGGNLALALMLHEIDAARVLPAGGLLFYGVFGRDFSTPSYRIYAEGELLTRDVMQRLWQWYDPHGTAKDDPYAVPLLASDAQLLKLPPLFLLSAELDPLTSDTINLKRRLDALGRRDEFWLEPGVIHGFLQMTATLKAARRATAMAVDAANRFLVDAAAEQPSGAPSQD